MLAALSRRAVLGAAGLLVARPGGARALSIRSRYFRASDGPSLHYLETGSAALGAARTIVFVPGWSMPAWIWGPQLAYFARAYRAIAFDPRGQGESEVPENGYNPTRRGEDIAELIAALGDEPVLLVGWSLGVLDTLAYVHTHGDARLAGLVLIDNSIGEEPAPLAPPRPRHTAPPLPEEERMRLFVRAMFRKPQSADYLERLTEATLVTPEFARRLLLSYPEPRSYWRDAVYQTRKPILYAVTPRWAAQAANLARHHPSAETALFADCGHALFVDDAARFNTLLADFIARRVWRV
jgi:microsomal epoxide hydrolase